MVDVDDVAPDQDVDRANILAIVALVVGGLGLITGVVAFARRRTA